MTVQETKTPHRRYRYRRRWPYLAAAGLLLVAAALSWQLWRLPWVSAIAPGPDAGAYEAPYERFRELYPRLRG